VSLIKSTMLEYISMTARYFERKSSAGDQPLGKGRADYRT
jgi:hypothetical protein